MFKTKRKNDAPRSRRPLLIMASLLFLAFGVIIAAQFLLPDDPTGHLFYVYSVDPTTEAYVRYDFQEGQSYSNHQPQIPLINVVSHDGQREAVWDRGDGQHQSTLRLRDTTTQKTVRVLGHFYNFVVSPLDWSPDDQWIAFSAYSQPLSGQARQQDDLELWLVNAITGDSRRLTENTYYDASPFFSPDGRTIAYVSMADGAPRLYIMDLESGDSRLVTANQRAYDIAWSPDGEWLAFTTDTTANTSYNTQQEPGQYVPVSLWLIRADGTHAQLFAANLGSVYWGLRWLERFDPTPTP